MLLLLLIIQHLIRGSKNLDSEISSGGFSWTALNSSLFLARMLAIRVGMRRCSWIAWPVFASIVRPSASKINGVTLNTIHTHTHNRLTAFFSRTTWVGQYQKDKPFWILLKQEMTGWQWHQPNYMQIVCTSLQTDNHTSTSSLHIFYRPDAFPAARPTTSKH